MHVAIDVQLKLKESNLTILQHTFYHRKTLNILRCLVHVDRLNKCN